MKLYNTVEKRRNRRADDRKVKVYSLRKAGILQGGGRRLRR